MRNKRIEDSLRQDRRESQYKAYFFHYIRSLTSWLNRGEYRSLPIYHLFLIAAVGLIAYSNVFNVPFVFDDLNAETGIAGNPVIKDLYNFISSSKGYEYNPRRFVGYLTFALNYYAGGLDVTGYHIVNLAIHLINASLVYFLVLLAFQTPYFRRETLDVKRETSGNQDQESKTDSRFTIHGSRLFALAVALLFVSHPIQTQAVTYIVQRFSSLATLFYLLSVVMYIKGRLTSSRTGRLASYLLCLLSSVCAMKTKEITFTLPLMIFLCEFTFFRSTLKRKLLLLIPVLLTLVIITISMLHIDKPLGEALSDLSEKARVQTDMARWDYLMTEMRVISTYIRLIIFPVNQNLYYDYPMYRSFFNPPVFLSFLFLATLFGIALYLLYKSRQADEQTGQQADRPTSRQADEQDGKHGGLAPTSHVSSASVRTQADSPGRTDPPGAGDSPFTIDYSRLIGFGILWFFIALSVESSFVPIEDVIFEHRLYLPSVGAFIALAAFLSFIALRVKGRPLIGKAVIPGFVALIVTLTAATWARNTVWQNEVTLMEDVAIKSPNNAKVRNGLGHAYMKKGWNDKAIEQFLAALALRPDYARARNSLGVAFGKKGLLDKALEEFSYALSLEPRNPEIYNNIAVVYRAKGDSNREITYFQAALEFDPNLALTHYNLGKAYAARGWHKKAEEHFKRAHALDSNTY